MCDTIDRLNLSRAALQVDGGAERDVTDETTDHELRHPGRDYATRPTDRRHPTPTRPRP